MYIAPGTVISFCSGVRLSPDYKNTIYFSNATAQQAYFAGKVAKRVDAQSYQRINKNSMRVEGNVALYYGFTYLYFQNSAYDSKYIYCFIIETNYINDNTTEIVYEIDILQTWLTDITFGRCFVEREHVMSDKIGEHTAPEPLSSGAMVCRNIREFQGTEKAREIIVLARARQSDDDPTEGFWETGFPSPIIYETFTGNDESMIMQLIDRINDLTENNRENTVISVFMFSDFYIGEIQAGAEYPSVGGFETDSWFPEKHRHDWTMPKNFYEYGTDEYFTPHNNKLLCFPYNYCCVDSGNDTKIYKYENFYSVRHDGSTTISFDTYGLLLPNPQVVCRPVNYNGRWVGSAWGGADTYTYDSNGTEEIVLSGFPQIPYIIDTYRAWLAQKSTGEAITFAETLASGIGSAISLNFGGVANTIGNMMTQTNDAILEVTRGSESRGNINGDVDCVLGQKSLKLKKIQIKTETAKMIDDFFDVYGYQISRIKVPNRNGRNHWNYTKTQECVVYGNAPAEVLRKVAGIMDAGVTWWRNGDEIGNYNLDNTL